MDRAYIGVDVHLDPKHRIGGRVEAARRPANTVDWITLELGGHEVNLFPHGTATAELADVFYQVALDIRAIIGDDVPGEGPGGEVVPINE